MRYLILVWACLFAFSSAANAALFSDGEARERIKELEQQVQTQNQATQETIAELKKTQETLNQKLAEIESVIKGQLEVATHNIEMGQQRQRDLYADIDARLRKIESGVQPGMGGQPGFTDPAMDPNAAAPSVPADASSSVTATVAPTLEPAGSSSEIQDFEKAQSLYQAGKYKEAFSAYEKFLQAYPNSSHAPEAQYALGYTQFSLKNYKAAMNTQQKLIKQYPTHPKVPEAMFSIANSQIQLADVEGARQPLKTLLARYPNSSVAPSAKKRLAVLDSIKSR